MRGKVQVRHCTCWANFGTHPHGEHQEDEEPLDVLEHHHQRVHKGELGCPEDPACKEKVRCTEGMQACNRRRITLLPEVSMQHSATDSIAVTATDGALRVS